MYVHTVAGYSTGRDWTKQGLFSVFSSGYHREDRPKAQNVRGGCLLGGPRTIATAVVRDRVVVRLSAVFVFTAFKSIFLPIYQ